MWDRSAKVFYFFCFSGRCRKRANWVLTAFQPFCACICWPQTNRLWDISAPKMGLFEITRELQFRICNNGKLPANLDTARKGEYYYQREKAIERAIANSVCLSHICSVLLCESMDCSLPGSSVHGILQARILKWVAMPSSRVSSWSRDRTCVSYVSCVGRQVIYHECHLGSLSKQRVHGFSLAESLPGKKRSLLPVGLSSQGRVGELILLLSQFYLIEVSVYYFLHIVSLLLCTVADSCWCMAKPIQYCKVISLKLKQINLC